MDTAPQGSGEQEASVDGAGFVPADSAVESAVIVILSAPNPGETADPQVGDRFHKNKCNRRAKEVGGPYNGFGGCVGRPGRCGTREPVGIGVDCAWIVVESDLHCETDVDPAETTMMTCENSTPQRHGEHAKSDDGTAGGDDAGPSRSCIDDTGETGDLPVALDGDGAGFYVDISDATGAGAFDQQTYHALSERLLREAGRGVCAGGMVRVRLVGDDEMSRTHERFCGVRGTTDVITFDLADGDSARGAPLDVDLIVCVDEAVRQAERRNHSIETELALYTLHGVLHALGYDDRDKVSYQRMHAREDEVFRSLGLKVAFGRGEHA